ncbi:ATP-binding protein [Streptomyces sp. SCSIO 30461]|uniref:ATP-binding protein n=1 Tax=Streptomyces sp. SCSIO 30461 TaxID=3118085 RepID=UPI0030D5BDC5
MGLNQRRRAEFTLAVNEVASNSLRHGGGAGTLRLYRSADSLCCQVTDSGAGFNDDVIPGAVPEVETSAGRGLWLVRQITDRLEVTENTVGADVTFSVRLDRT